MSSIIYILSHKHYNSWFIRKLGYRPATSRDSALVAVGALLGFVVFGHDPEHIVAGDADSVNHRLLFLVGRPFRLLLFTHAG